MKISIRDDQGHLTVLINGKPIEGVVAAGVQGADGERSVLTLVLENAAYELTLDDVEVNRIDDLSQIGEFIRSLPAGAVEAAAMSELGMGNNNMVRNILDVIATLVEQSRGVVQDEDSHGCDHQDGGFFDDGSDLDLPPGSGRDWNVR